MNDGDSSAYIITLCCVTFFALLWCWWSRCRRHADAPSSPLASVSSCVEVVVRPVRASDHVSHVGSVQSGLACVGVGGSRAPSPFRPHLQPNGPALSSKDGHWAFSLPARLARSCLNGVWAVALMLQMLCSTSRASTLRCRAKRATSRHRGNRPTRAPWHYMHPNNNNNRRARANAYSSPDHSDFRTT